MFVFFVICVYNDVKTSLLLSFINEIFKLKQNNYYQSQRK